MRRKDNELLAEAYQRILETYDQNVHNDMLRSSPFAPKPENPNKEIPYDLKKRAINQFAANAHEVWRNSLPEDQKNKPRIRSKNGGPEADINVPFDKLHPTAKQENLAAGQAAFEAVTEFPNDIEKGSEYIHNEWMKRNPKDDYTAALHVSYKSLPEDEKEKDRVHYREMSKLIGKPVQN